MRKAERRDWDVSRVLDEGVRRGSREMSWIWSGRGREDGAKETYWDWQHGLSICAYRRICCSGGHDGKSCAGGMLDQGMALASLD